MSDVKRSLLLALLAAAGTFALTTGARQSKGRFVAESRPTACWGSLR